MKNITRQKFKLAIKWPYGEYWGWVIGTVRKLRKGQQYKNHFEVRWEDGIVTYWPKEPNSEYGTNKKWVLVAPT